MRPLKHVGHVLTDGVKVLKAGHLGYGGLDLLLLVPLELLREGEQRLECRVLGRVEVILRLDRRGLLGLRGRSVGKEVVQRGNVHAELVNQVRDELGLLHRGPDLKGRPGREKRADGLDRVLDAVGVHQGPVRVDRFLKALSKFTRFGRLAQGAGRLRLPAHHGRPDALRYLGPLGLFGRLPRRGGS